MPSVTGMLLDGLRRLDTDDELVQLMYTAAVLLILPVRGMLIVDIAVDGTLFFLKAHALHVVMVHHHGRQQHREGCHNQREGIQSASHVGKDTTFRAHVIHGSAYFI